MALISADETASLAQARRLLRALTGEACYGLVLTLLAATATLLAAAGGPVWLPAAIIVAVGAAGAVQTAGFRQQPTQALGYLPVVRTTALAAASLLLVQSFPTAAGRWT